MSDNQDPIDSADQTKKFEALKTQALGLAVSTCVCSLLAGGLEGYVIYRQHQLLDSYEVMVAEDLVVIKEQQKTITRLEDAFDKSEILRARDEEIIGLLEEQIDLLRKKDELQQKRINLHQSPPP